MKKPEYLTTPDYWRPFWRRRRSSYAAGLPWYNDWLLFQKQHLPQEPGLMLLEVGCAASRWLPIYAEQFGYHVYGVDYDERGCHSARSILLSRNQTGRIVCEDFVDFAAGCQDTFDVVVSFGFVEHFAGREIIDTLFACLKPGGLVFATVPNLQGCQGWFKLLLEEWRTTHRLFTPAGFRNLFEQSGFSEVIVQYAGGLGVPVPRSQGWRRFLFPIHAAMWALILVGYGLSRVFGWAMRGKNSASSIMLVGRKPESAGPATPAATPGQ